MPACTLVHCVPDPATPDVADAHVLVNGASSLERLALALWDVVAAPVDRTCRCMATDLVRFHPYTTITDDCAQVVADLVATVEGYGTGARITVERGEETLVHRHFMHQFLELHGDFIDAPRPLLRAVNTSFGDRLVPHPQAVELIDARLAALQKYARDFPGKPARTGHAIILADLRSLLRVFPEHPANEPGLVDAVAVELSLR